jgi:hypothetical protein
MASELPGLQGQVKRFSVFLRVSASNEMRWKKKQ